MKYFLKFEKQRLKRELNIIEYKVWSLYDENAKRVTQTIEEKITI
jgi:hypothetical protein